MQKTDQAGKDRTSLPEKLSDARKEGNVAKSREIVNAVSLIVAFCFLKSTIGNIGTSIMRIYTLVYERIPTYASDTRDVTVSSAMLILSEMMKQMIQIILPFLVLGFGISFLVEVFQVKWMVTGKPLKPKFSKLNPGQRSKKNFFQTVTDEYAKVCWSSGNLYCRICSIVKLFQRYAV